MASRRNPLSWAACLVVLAFVSVYPAPTPAANGAFERLYREALEARAAGDFKTAIARLEEVIAFQPDDVDALLLLGTLYGFERRFEEALAALERGLSLAPDYTDIRLAIARIKAWQGEFDSASQVVEAVLAEQPDNLEALIQRGRLAYYQDELGRAEAAFSEVLKRQPENSEALVGLGDAKWAQGEYAEARAYYRRAAAAQPDAPEAAERLRRKPPRDFAWRLDTTGSYSAFSRQSRSPWRETFNQISFRPSRATIVHGRVELSERFDHFDTYLQAGVDHRFSTWLSGYLYAGGTPSANFRERWAVLGGAAARLWKGKDMVGATVLMLDAKRATYSTGDVNTVKPGLQQYFLAGRLWLTGQWINTIDESNNHLQGWLGRIDAQVTDGVRIYGGTANAPETAENVTIDTRAVFGGVIVDLTDRISARLDYAREDRERSFIRQVVSLGISFRF